MIVPMPRLRSLVVGCGVAALIVALTASREPAARAQEATADLEALFATAQQAYNDQRWELAASSYQAIRDRDAERARADMARHLDLARMAQASEESIMLPSKVVR